MLLYLVVDDNVVFGRHVISDVVVDDEPEQPVEESEIDLLVHLLEVRLQHDVTLALTRVPHILQVVDTYTNNTHCYTNNTHSYTKLINSGYTYCLRDGSIWKEGRNDLLNNNARNTFSYMASDTQLRTTENMINETLPPLTGYSF